MPQDLPCPIERMIEHSAEHFIPSAEETFEQLAARRAGNMDLMIRFLDTLAAKAPNAGAWYSVNGARDSLLDARNRLRSAAGR